ncbi:mechanosensitive ion channel family protein [Halioglobus pacificus]|uniref:mechanosensitive ion channel family protein n=1 Tax=Parahalioglobus pacificus TaxID=930806 RepID=UPI00167C0B78|nr:mechanosensitive ion channel family protein [Halioglobus pacificus]
MRYRVSRSQSLSAVAQAFLLLLALLTGASVYAEKAVDESEINERVQQLDRTIERAGLLQSELDVAIPADKTALEYRLDETSIEALRLIDQISVGMAQLPEGNITRNALMERFSGGLLGLETALFERLENLNKRIQDAESIFIESSGTDRVASQAFSFNLRTLRVRYYGALVDVIHSREALALGVDDLERVVGQRLRQEAERSVARVELAAAAFAEVNRRLSAGTGNADLSSALSQLKINRDFHLSILSALVDQMDRLDLNVASYRTVIVRESNIVSVGLFEQGVLSQMLTEGWANLRDAIVKGAPDTILQLLIFVIILLVFRLISRVTKRGVEAALERSNTKMSALLKDILISGVGGTIMIFGIMVALSQIGITLGPMLAGLGVAGFIVGFALQDTLGNFASGAMILIYRPYDVDDFVEVNGAAGLVKKMNLVSTTIVTFDNQTLVIPNSKIWGDVIKNVTHQRVRRVDMEFGISYGDDIEHAERVLKEVLDEHDLILPKPEPLIVVNSLGDSSVNIAVRPWVRTEDYWKVYWALTKQVKMRFDKEGISIPFPQRDVHHYSEDKNKYTGERV